jgi:hypothetical protein
MLAERYNTGEFRVGTPQGPSWEERLAALLAPFKAVGGAAARGARTGIDALKLPGAYLADKGSELYHGALGLDDPNAGSNFRGAVDEFGGALDETIAPLKSGMQGARGGATNAMEYMRNQAIAAGAKPQRTDVMPGMNLAPGGMDAELRAGAPASPGPARQVPRPPIPMMPQRPPVQAPGGQVPIQAPVTPQVQRGALEEPPAEAPRPSLMAQFREKNAAIAPAEGKMSEQEKKQRALEFFLNMLARNKGGSTFLQNAAGAGLDTSAGVRSDREKAQARAEAGRKEKREDVFREIGFGDKDEDNRRLDAGEARRMKLLEKQISQGKVSVQKNAGTGTYVILDATTGETKDTKIKYPKEVVRDQRSAELQLLEHLKKNPGDLETVLKLKGKGDDDADEIFDAAVKRVTTDLTGEQKMPSAIEEMRSARELARGGSRPQLPKGIPPGSKQVGTHEGKPVYQSPDGKRFKVE